MSLNHAMPLEAANENEVQNPVYAMLETELDEMMTPLLQGKLANMVERLDAYCKHMPDAKQTLIHMMEPFDMEPFDFDAETPEQNDRNEAIMGDIYQFFGKNEKLATDYIQMAHVFDCAMSTASIIAPMYAENVGRAGDPYEKQAIQKLADALECYSGLGRAQSGVHAQRFARSVHDMCEKALGQSR